MTHACPVRIKNLGTFSSTVAVHRTLVKPVEITTDPWENLRGFFSNVTGLSSVFDLLSDLNLHTSLITIYLLDNFILSINS